MIQITLIGNHLLELDPITRELIKESDIFSFKLNIAYGIKSVFIEPEKADKLSRRSTYDKGL